VNKRISSALISVFDKDGLAPIVEQLHQLGITLYSTGGTQTFIENMGIPVTAVEDLTGYPSIFGGRVKTLHPGVLGGILYRRDEAQDLEEAVKFNIQAIDCVIVDLYPFEKTVASGASHEDTIEKIDIGGIALIRGAAKNFNDVVIVPSKNEYSALHELLVNQKGETSLEQRQFFAKQAFEVSSHYDSAIYSYFKGNEDGSLRIASRDEHVLRYGENPHQKGSFFGDLDALFTKLNGKELSYNNLLDVVKSWEKFHTQHVDHTVISPCPTLSLIDNVDNYVDQRIKELFLSTTIVINLVAESYNGDPRLGIRYNDVLLYYQTLPPGHHELSFDVPYTYPAAGTRLEIFLDNKMQFDTQVDEQGNILHDKNIRFDKLVIDRVNLLGDGNFFYDHGQYFENLQRCEIPMPGLFGNSSIVFEFQEPFWRHYLANISGTLEYQLNSEKEKSLYYLEKIPTSRTTL
jgi:hypothetical protein